ncbi:hypothetical protein O181_038585 [Austropuccinia psidii MF-1]|uniref:Uncharacterized protein n=1 Tax=Austropuccinia psidii MF-1 TaxID=1389203 RepID=A0A9Q3DA21_9BASI|nr:hypothetical protein [Austropuccinia psidii MF-1]
MSSTDRIHKKILEIQEKLIEIIKKEGKNKSTSYTPQNSKLEEKPTLPRSFRPDGSPSPYPISIATSTPYTEKIQNNKIKEVLNQLKALSEAVNPPRRNWNNNQEQRFPQNNQPYRPSNPLLPSSSSYQPYIPAQMDLRPPLRCAYCKKEVHSATKCTHLAEDLDRRIVRTQGASYLFPNYQRVPMEGNEKEEVKPAENRSEDKSASISHVGDWSNWKPPTLSSANDPFDSHIGLRQTKQMMESQYQNQEPKKKASIPCTYIEEEKEEERIIIPTKFQNSNIPKPEQPEEEIGHIANKSKDEEIPKE